MKCHLCHQRYLTVNAVCIQYSLCILHFKRLTEIHPQSSWTVCSTAPLCSPLHSPMGWSTWVCHKETVTNTQSSVCLVAMWRPAAEHVSKRTLWAEPLLLISPGRPNIKHKGKNVFPSVYVTHSPLSCVTLILGKNRGLERVSFYTWVKMLWEETVNRN